MDTKRKALITGITGQSGSFLAELLLEKGYEVHGIIRRSSSFNTGRIDHIFDKLHLHYGDVTDSLMISNLISQIKPHECYHLAAQSHVAVSFQMPLYTGNVDALGVLNILEAVRIHCPTARVYNAATSELYGGMEYNREDTGYTETSPFHPRSPYGVAKLYGYWISKNYREAYGLHISNGILFNHESERRPKTFITKKVVDCLIEHKYLNKPHLKVGNLEARRDWGAAIEYVEGMWLMLQQEKPDDYVLATGESHSVRELIEEVAKLLDYEIDWKGEKEDEKGYDKATGKLLVEIDPVYFRPSEVDYLLGNPQKAKDKLDWEPKIKFTDLVKLMVVHKLKNL